MKKNGRFFVASRWLLWILTTGPADVANAFTLPSSTGSLRGISKKRNQSIMYPPLELNRNSSPRPLSMMGTSSSSALVSTAAALLALMGSSAIGMQSEKRLPSSGILTTLTVAALLSNLVPVIPLQHALYDLCWSWILPGSLTLLLLGYQPPQNKVPTTSPTSENASQQQKWPIGQAVARVAGPFFLATVGSIVGCWASFQWATSSPSTPLTAFSWFSGWSTHQVQMAVSCLAASYVGGSVNLFATAKLIQAPAVLLSSLATADLVVMALYFSALSTLLEWNWLKRLFYVHNTRRNSDSHDDPRKEDIVNEESTTKGIESITRTDTPSPIPDSTAINTVDRKGRRPFHKNSIVFTPAVTTSLFLLGMTAMIGALANSIEAVVGRWIPGTGCGVIALVTPLIRPWAIGARSWRWWQTRATTMTTTESTLRLSTLAQGWADYFFLLFFASIGVGVDLPRTVQMGPSCLLLSLGALLVHLVVIVVGSYWLLPCQSWKIGLEEICIASNAAIGGPVTAAAFCTRLRRTTTPTSSTTTTRTMAATDNPEDDDDDESFSSSMLLVGRTTAATVWGIVGYAIGTMVGMGLYQCLGGTVVRGMIRDGR